MALNAKSYYCFDNIDDKKDKYSSKGISHAFKLTKKDYLDVLMLKLIPVQENKGFQYKNNVMLTYTMKKEGLKYLYCKRKVLSDGMSTTYLDI